MLANHAGSSRTITMLLPWDMYLRFHKAVEGAFWGNHKRLLSGTLSTTIQQRIAWNQAADCHSDRFHDISRYLFFWAIGAEVPFVSTHVFLHSLVGLQADWWFITENRGLGSVAGGKRDYMRESPHWSQNNRRLQRDQTEQVLSCLVFDFRGLMLLSLVYFGLDWENMVWHFVLSYFYPYVSTLSTSVRVLASPSLNLHGATMF